MGSVGEAKGPAFGRGNRCQGPWPMPAPHHEPPDIEGGATESAGWDERRSLPLFQQPPTTPRWLSPITARRSRLSLRGP